MLEFRISFIKSLKMLVWEDLFSQKILIRKSKFLGIFGLNLKKNKLTSYCQTAISV